MGQSTRVVVIASDMDEAGAFILDKAAPSRPASQALNSDKLLTTDTHAYDGSRTRCARVTFSYDQRREAQVLQRDSNLQVRQMAR